MADGILSTIAGEILKKLGSLALQEFGLFWGVHGELEKLKNTVTTIEAVLLQAEKQPTMSVQVKNYIENLKQVVYDADDLLDDFSTEALRREVMSGNKMTREVRIFFSPSNQFVYSLKMAHEIKAIRERLDAIKADKELHIGEGTVDAKVVTNYRETHSYIGAEEVIGRDDDKIKMIEMLMGSNVTENVSIISIVGIGGLGKTTLAQLVYNDDKVKNHFNLKMWVCVSDVFDVKIIVENIIKSATGREPGNLNLDQLQDLLQRELEGKKYLLILDDVWNEDRGKWLNLERLLMGGAKGSRIVVTTRSRRVAEITSIISPYILEGLSETNSWSLFARMAFGQGNKPTNQNIVTIAKEIIKNCVGVPLAIRMMGSLLYSKKSEDEWASFKIELSKLPQKEGDILPTLKLSYNSLEPHLKHCFAYCRLFPKDYEIGVKTLIYLWIGQGFIKSSNLSQSLEQIGYEYFLFLLWRCFFQEPKEDELGNIIYCKMHDLMHDLAVEVTGNESIMISSDKENIPKNTRHVSFNHDFYWSQKIPVCMLKANKIRTFLLLESSHEEIWSDAIVSKFRCLRMLDLHGLGIERVPHSIGKLKHLRYLDLSSNYRIMILPSSITRLQNLLVVKLSDCWSLKKLPNDIKKLVSLTVLEIDGCGSLTHMPRGLGQLTSLEKLTRFIVSNDDSNFKHRGGLNELKGLNSLRGELSIERLHLVKNADSEYKAANLKEKEHLQSLALEWEWGYVDGDAMSMEGLQPHRNLKKLSVLYYPGVMSPTWLSLLTNLVNLQLLYCERVKHLPPLDGLTSLRDLTIKNLTHLEYIHCYGSNCLSATFFSSLEKLEIRDCPNLKGWKIVSMETTTSSTTELPPFPCLSKLEIWNCPYLTSMPLFPSTTELVLMFLSGKPLEETMMMKSKAASSSCSSPPLPLSKLKSLWIHNIHDLEYLPHQGMRNLTSLHSLEIWSCKVLLSLEGEGFSGLISLRSLLIHHCQSLKSISGVFQHCTALEKLDIKDCVELDISDGMQHQALRSLSYLEIRSLPQLASLPEWLQYVTTLKSLAIFDCKRLRTLSPVFEHLTTLEELRIRDCGELDLSDVAIQFQASRSLRLLDLGDIPKLATLPEWLQHFTTLQELCIYSCSNFTSLPEAMRYLTSLQKLEIFGCPQLSERCRNNMGVDWPNIAHIPNIEIDEQKIQLGGCYQLG